MSMSVPKTNSLRINDNLIKLYIYLNKQQNFKYLDVERGDVYEKYLKESNCMDSSSIMNVLRLVFDAADGKYKESLKEANLEEMFNAIPVSMYNRLGAFINSNGKFNEDFCKRFEKDIVFNFIPFDKEIMNICNNDIDKKFPDWPLKNDKFFDKPINDINRRVYIKDQSYFSGEWKKSFDKEYGRDNIDFFIGDNKKVKVHMMSSGWFEESLLTYLDEKLNILYVSLPYKEKYSMLVIMPKIPHTKMQLLDLLKNGKISVNSIMDFFTLNGKYVKYDKKMMPKFSFESKFHFSNCQVSDDDDIPIFIKTILDNSKIDLNNMIENFQIGCDSIKLTSTSKVKNIETGTYIKSETNFDALDGCGIIDKVLLLNNSFIFIIYDQKYIFHKIGVCLGENDETVLF